jgi:hypothetical protein
MLAGSALCYRCEAALLCVLLLPCLQIDAIYAGLIDIIPVRALELCTWKVCERYRHLTEWELSS